MKDRQEVGFIELRNICSRCGQLIEPGQEWWHVVNYITRKPYHPVCYPKGVAA